MSPPTPPGLPLGFQLASHITPRRISWVWPNRLAVGKLAILDGDPGLGKSLIALDLCARLTRGLPFPDDSPGQEPCSVVVLNAEDDQDDTVRPRLESLGADLERVVVFHPTDGQLQLPLSLRGLLDLLEQVLTGTRARLVVFDPITDFLKENVFGGSERQVRRALQQLRQLAVKNCCAILLVRHLNKLLGGRALYRGLGSIAFLALCRSGWMVGRDPKDQGRCVLAQLKNNNAPPQPSLAYSVTVPPRPDDPPMLSWHGTSPLTDDDLLARPRRDVPPDRPCEEAAEFLMKLLSAGPLNTRQIWAAAEREGHTERTQRRTKRQLGIRSVRVWAEGDRLSFWLLPGQEMPPMPAPDPGTADFDKYLDDLGKKYPSAGPLDED